MEPSRQMKLVISLREREKRPVAAALNLARVGFEMRSSSVGWFGLVTSKLPQAASVIMASAGAMNRSFFSMLEPHREREEELARGRIGTEVHVAGDRLLAIVARFGVVAEVLGVQPEVAAAHHRLHVARAENTGVALRQRERELHLTKPDEVRGLHEWIRDAGVQTGVGARLPFGRGLVGRQLIADRKSVV